MGIESGSNHNKLNTGATLETSWGTVTLESFDTESRAHLMINYAGREIPAWPRYDGEICLAVEGGLLYVADIADMDPNSGTVTIDLYAEPRFEPREYMDVPVEDIIAADDEELYALAARMFAEA